MGLRYYVRPCLKKTVVRLAEEVALVGRIVIMEANVARLGFDPEEMHKPILKPVRTTSRVVRASMRHR